jgi:uncharacterized membrane protein YciS (DUF1049 family)
MRFPLFILVLFAVAVAVMFAVPNRELVTLRFWPFDFQIELGLYLVVFAALFLGFFFGWIGSWFAQRKWRKLARERARHIEGLEKEIAGLTDAAKAEAAAGGTSLNAIPTENKSPAITLGH